MYISADIKYNCRKSRFTQKERRLFLEKKIIKKILIYNLKDFIYYKFICKMYKLYNKRFSKKV